MKIAISIHAPPRGATYDDGTRVLKSYLFQFTPLREGRRITDYRNQRHHLFQFTPLREGRLGAAGGFLHYMHISIHAPPRGATQLTLNSVTGELFQFTPLREGRRGGGRIPTLYAHFNSRPSARGDNGLLSA